MFTFPFKSEIPQFVGLGVHKLVGEKLEELGCKKVMLVMDKGVAGTNVPQKIIDLINAKGIEVVTNSDVLPDPPVSRINEIYAEAKEAGIDGIVALGGGSVIDTAKSVKLLMRNEGPLSNYFEPFLPSDGSLPLICIPTTSGTGSEGNPMVVVTDDLGSKLKVGTGGPGFAPNLTLVDGELQVGIPPAVTAACGMDALSHCIDGLFSVWTNSVTQALGVQGIRMIKKSLPAAYKDGSNLQARQELATASNLGGIIINNVLCCVCHAMGHTHGALFHNPHGITVAIWTPAPIEWIADALPDEVKMIADAFDVKYADSDPIQDIARKTAQAIYEFGKSINIPDLKEVIPNKEDAYKMIPLAVAEGNAAMSPKKVEDADIKWIIDRTYEYTLGGK